MVIKHRDMNVPCQVAIKIDTYSDSGNKTAKQKGGSGRTCRNKKCSTSMSKSRFSKSRRNKTMRR